MSTKDHYSLKCDMCCQCIREGEEARRLGSASLTIWTRVGLFEMTLCGRCARPGIEAIVRAAHYFGFGEDVDMSNSPLLLAIEEKS